MMKRCADGILSLAALTWLTFAGCAGSGGSPGTFSESEKPRVEFFQLELTDRVQRVTNPRDAVEAYLKITNRSPDPIELFRVKARLRGQIGAITSTDLPSDSGNVRQGFYLVTQNIPPDDERIVRVKMTLETLSYNTSTSSGPMVPTLRGQLYFHTSQGDVAVAIEEQLTELDSGEPEED